MRNTQIKKIKLNGRSGSSDIRFVGLICVCVKLDS
jgi:hypothetical protein